MPEKVYFIPAGCDDGDKAVSDKMAKLLMESGLVSCFEKNDYTAVKIHVGEHGNETSLRSEWLPGVVTVLKNAGARPFFTDTSTLYTGRRSNAVDHAELASEHGFDMQGAGAPFLPLDGLRGDEGIPVSINGEIYGQVGVAGGLLRVQSMLLVSHLTGHVACGMGGAIKNLGMGCTGRTGKRQQHCAMAPRIKSGKCTGCEECVKYCPVDAIAMKGDTAVIDRDKCIGCGQCLAVCRFGAVSFDWGVEGTELQKRVAEHALGVVSGKAGKIVCLTVMLCITDGCDCMNMKMSPALEDIGILLSVDPVAIDAAAADMVLEKTGKTMGEISGQPSLDAMVQVEHGRKIGLGNREYELVTLK